MALIEKGNVTPRIIAGSEIIRSVDGDSATVIISGKYNLLEVPEKGSLYTYKGVELRVVSTRLRHERAGLGTLTISLADKDSSGGGGSGSEEPNETIEIDYTLVNKPLEQHPRYVSIFTSDDEDIIAARTAIELWRNLDLSAIARKMRYHYPIVAEPDPGNDDHWSALGGLYREFCEKIMLGIEAPFEQVPIVRRTSTLQAPPSSSMAGMRENPPQTYAITGKSWLKTADRAVRRSRRGAWERTEEWAAFDYLDEDIYPNAPAP